MSARWKPDFRTILYILIVVLVIVAIVYLIFSPSEESEKTYSPEQVLTNKNFYVNKDIIVEGIYHSEYDSVGSPTGEYELEPTNLLSLDLQTNNITDVFDGNKYRFHGKLEWVNININVILVVDEIDEV